MREAMQLYLCDYTYTIPHFTRIPPTAGCFLLSEKVRLMKRPKPARLP